MPEVIYGKRLDPDPWIFETIAKMRLGPDPVHLAMGVLLGSVAAYDGVLNGVYSYDKNSVLADNGTSVIQPTAVTGPGRWRQVIYCPPCPDLCSGWNGDPFAGDTFAARFTRSGASSNYLNMATDTALPGQFLPQNTSFSIGAWVYMNERPASSDIVTRWGGGGNEQFILGFSGATNQFYFAVRDPALADDSITAPTVIAASTWYFVVAAMDVLVGKLRIWVNGVQTSANHGSGIKGGPILGLLVGGRAAAGSTFDGKIETLFIHRGSVWNDAQVLMAYNAGIGVRARRWLHFGLPLPTVIYEWEDASNVGKNNLNDPTYDLVNNNSSGGTAGLVTLSSGLPLS